MTKRDDSNSGQCGEDCFHQFLMDNIADACYLHDADGQMVEVNAAASRNTGYSRAELLGMSVCDLDSLIDSSEIIARLSEMSSSPGTQRVFRTRHWHKSGRCVDVEVNLVCLDQQGPARFLATVRDASEQVRLEKELEYKIAFDDLLLDISTRLINVAPERIDAVINEVLADIGQFFNAGRTYLFSIDLDARTISNTHEWSADGVPPEIDKLQGRPFSDFPWLMSRILKGKEAHLPDVDEMSDEYRQERDDYRLQQSIRSLVIVPVMEDDRPRGLFGLDAIHEKRYWNEDIRNNLRLLGQMIASAMDAVQLGSELQYLAYHDPLTGLPNRKLVQDRIEHAIAECSRKPADLAVMLLDLDDFKLVNDSLSHSVGDEYLRQISDRLKNVCRSADTVGRQGGDEFVLVVEVNDAADAAQVAERTLQAIAEPVVIDGANIIGHSSIGISLYPHDGRDHDKLIRNADLAMYEAKSAGKNRFAFFDREMTARAQADLGLRHDLDRALQCDELRLHFQPRVDITRSRICGLEALVRWQHPTRGLLHPGEFLPLAERSDLICRIDHWVLRQALQQTASWLEAARDCRVAVNLSARDLYERQHLEYLLEILAEAREHPSLPLEIEITESMLMDDIELAIDNLKKIKAVAPEVTIAIDDFGSGYSSLNYLRRIPMDTLKIDRAFIRDLNESAGGAEAIVRSIVELARNLGLHVVAEGVETEFQLALLRAMGVQEVQGFLFGRPAPLGEIAPGAVPVIS